MEKTITQHLLKQSYSHFKYPISTAKEECGIIILILVFTTHTTFLELSQLVTQDFIVIAPIYLLSTSRTVERTGRSKARKSLMGLENESLVSKVEEEKTKERDAKAITHQ